MFVQEVIGNKKRLSDMFLNKKLNKSFEKEFKQEVLHCGDLYIEPFDKCFKTTLYSVISGNECVMIRTNNADNKIVEFIL